MHTRMYTHEDITRVLTHARVSRARRYTYIHTRKPRYTRIYIHAQSDIHTHIYVCVCMYVCAFIINIIIIVTVI